MCLRNFGNKIKVIYCLLLSGVLLLLLFAGASSYCREVSAYDIANCINNLYKAKKGSFLTTNDINIPICETIAYNFNQHEGHYLIFLDSNTNVVFHYSSNNSDCYLNSAYGGYVPIFKSNGQQLVYQLNSKQFVNSNFGSQRNWVLNGYMYTDCNIYSSINSTTISYSAGTIIPSNFDFFADTLYITDYFSFNYNSNLNNINVDEEFTNLKQITISDRLTNIADFGRTTHLQNVILTYWTYNKNLGYFEPFKTVPTNNYTIQSEDLGELFFTSSEFLPNSIMQYHLFSNDVDNFPALDILFYCVDNNTVIVNGNLDITNTFNNTYYNQYVYDNNNFIGNTSVGQVTNSSGDVTGYIDLQPITNGIEDIKDTLVDGSQTENIINSYISGDLPDVFGYQENFKTEYNLFWTPLNYLSTQIFNALTLNSTAVFNIPLRNGQTLVLRSSDFTVPDGPLKSFISLYLVFSTIYVVFLSFRRLIDNLNSAGISGVLEKQGVDPDYIKM